jgi:hypothetical protein
MVGRYGERITLMEKELPLFLVYLQKEITNNLFYVLDLNISSKDNK